MRAFLYAFYGIWMICSVKSQDCSPSNFTRQSPINIDTSKLHYKLSAKLKWSQTYSKKDTFSLTNTAVNFALRSNSTTQRQLAGGDVMLPYQFDQMTFHWGTDDCRGSEHTLNNRSFPFEAHTRHVQRQDNSTDQYLVVAYFFNITKTDNPGIQRLVETIPKIPHSNDSSTIDNFALTDLIDTHFLTYYEYEGSLPIPPWTESFRWYISTKVYGISERQIQVFRNAAQFEPGMINNYRCTQPLNGRTVDYVISI